MATHLGERCERVTPHRRGHGCAGEPRDARRRQYLEPGSRQLLLYTTPRQANDRDNNLLEVGN
jgi:hypothetical protein